MSQAIPDGELQMASHSETGRANPGWSGRIRPWIAYPLAVFLGTRLALLVLAFIAETAIPGRDGPGFYHPVPGNLWLDVWARWDSGFYLEIADQGYSLTIGEPSSVAFFPLYPLLINLVKLLVGNTVLAGALISHACFLGALVLLYRLTELEFGDRLTAERTVFYLASFPTALFFGAIYTESTFLLLSLAALYLARRRIWTWAGVFGMLAAATRIVGVTLLLPLLMMWLHAQGWTLRRSFTSEAWRQLGRGLRRDWAGLAWLMLVPVGIGSYMVFLSQIFGDPIAFWTVQGTFGRQGLDPFAAIARDLGPLLKQNFLTGPVYWNVILDLSAFVFAMVASISVGLRLGSAYALYVLVSIAIPIASGTGSLIRYVVVLFPLFMMLGAWGRRPSFDTVLRAIFPLGLGLLTVLFVNWIFVG